MNPIPLPNKPSIKALGDNRYELAFEPLYPGYGITIGNTLRRVLLSSMPGAAVTGVKIKYADHEFSTVPNVKEDVIQIILNLKQLRLRSHSIDPIRLSLKKKGEGVVTAGDIIETDQVEIVNKDLVICTLDNKNSDLDMELIVEQGRGYVPVEARENERSEVGMLSIDAIFTPIRSVFYDVSNVRVGQMTNFDKLVVNVETDGSITGEEAIDMSARILVDHFQMLFAGQNDHPAMVIPEIPEMSEEEGLPMPEMFGSNDAPEMAVGQSLDEVNLSNRAKNALIKNGINTVEALNALTDDEINNMSGLGEKTVTEILTLLGRN